MPKNYDLTFYKLIRSHIQHEDDLINHRLNWLLALQVLFFAAYGASFTINKETMDKIEIHLKSHNATIDSIRYSFASVGIISSILTYIGILAAVNSIIYFSREWKAYEKSKKFNEKIFPSITGRRFPGLITPSTLPIIFVLIWIVLIFPKTLYWLYKIYDFFIQKTPNIYYVASTFIQTKIFYIPVIVLVIGAIISIYCLLKDRRKSMREVDRSLEITMLDIVREDQKL